VNAQDWRKDNEDCIFYQNAFDKAYGVGHASFTMSPNGIEDWIVYHRMRDPRLLVGPLVQSGRSSLDGVMMEAQHFPGLAINPT
jgi:GH43 family beta-xylosidase